MSEYDATDLMIERTAREEQEELDRAHGQQILDATAARLRQGSVEDPLLEVLSRAHKAKAEEE
jgi:hypothetical protein